MADIENLKRLAVRAIPDAEWFKVGNLECHANVDNSAAAFIAEASPAAVLALIAENEENGANSAQWQKAFVRIAAELSVLAAQHGDFTDESTLQEGIDFLKSAMAERDRLKAELERVRADAERYAKLRRYAPGFDVVGLHSAALDEYVDTELPSAQGGGV